MNLTALEAKPFVPASDFERAKHFCSAIGFAVRSEWCAMAHCPEPATVRRIACKGADRLGDMKHFIFNVSDGDREQATSFLHAERWAVGREERHCNALAPGDLVLIHVAKPRCEFIGRAELATAFRDWTASEFEACPDGRAGGVSLADVEEWPHAVSLDVAVHRIDPTASNPYVQGNAAGFRSGIVLITAKGYATVVALSREARQT